MVVTVVQRRADKRRAIGETLQDTAMEIERAQRSREDECTRIYRRKKLKMKTEL